MTLEGKTVLVTGATGFLGGVTARRLAQEGARVRALARSPDRAKYLRDCGNVEIVYGDITQPETLRPVMRGVDTVFHTAVDYGNMERQRAVNVEGTRNLANAAADAGVRRLVHVSSIAVYGYALSGLITEAQPFAPRIHEPYAITKIDAERAVMEAGERRGLTYSIVRPGMIYGPRSGMWTKQMFKLARRRPTIFLGSGGGNAFPIFVDDVVDLMAVAAEHPSAVGLAFHCAPSPAPTWREFIGAYQRLTGNTSWLGIPYGLVKPIVSLIAMAVPSAHQFKDLPDYAAMTQATLDYSMERARTLLNWQPRVSLHEGVARCVPYLREQGLLK
jgi:2-alkyl-3-oxoalkanoate reductase